MDTETTADRSMSVQFFCPTSKMSHDPANNQFGDATKMVAENGQSWGVGSTVDSALRWDDPKYYPCRCPACGWEGMSNETEGGTPIADTGDYSDLVCPECAKPDGNYAHGYWIPVVEIPSPNTP